MHQHSSIAPDTSCADAKSFPCARTPWCVARGQASTALLMSVFLLFGQKHVGAQQWSVHEQRGSIELFSEFPISADVVMGQLDDIREDLYRHVGLGGSESAARSGRKVEIILFSSSASYRQYLSNRIPEALSRRAIFYKDGDLCQIYAFRHNQLLTDLRHEYTHAVLHQTLPYVPLWIDEGLAEYFEEQEPSRLRSPRFSAVKWKARTGWSPNLQQLEAMKSGPGMHADEYRDSWAWVCFLLNHSPESRSLLQNYVATIKSGEAPGTFSQWAARQSSNTLSDIGPYFRRVRLSVR